MRLQAQEATLESPEFLMAMRRGASMAADGLGLPEVAAAIKHSCYFDIAHQLARVGAEPCRTILLSAYSGMPNAQVIANWLTDLLTGVGRSLTNLDGAHSLAQGFLSAGNFGPIAPRFRGRLSSDIERGAYVIEVSLPRFPGLLASWRSCRIDRRCVQPLVLHGAVVAD